MWLEATSVLFPNSFCFSIPREVVRWAEAACACLDCRALTCSKEAWMKLLGFFKCVLGYQKHWASVKICSSAALSFLNHSVILKGKKKKKEAWRKIFHSDLTDFTSTGGCWKGDLAFFLGDPEELMYQYFKKFGDKPCCFTDLKVFVDLLPPSQYTKVRKYQEVVAGTAVVGCPLVPLS